MPTLAPHVHDEHTAVAVAASLAPRHARMIAPQHSDSRHDVSRLSSVGSLGGLFHVIGGCAPSLGGTQLVSAGGSARTLACKSGNLLQRPAPQKGASRRDISRLTSVSSHSSPVVQLYHHVVPPPDQQQRRRAYVGNSSAARSGRPPRDTTPPTRSGRAPPQPVPPHRLCSRQINPPAAHGCRPVVEPCIAPINRSASRPMSNRRWRVYGPLALRGSAKRRSSSREISPPQLFSTYRFARVAAAPAAMANITSQGSGRNHQSLQTTPPASMMTARSVASAAWVEGSCRQANAQLIPSARWKLLRPGRIRVTSS